MAATGSGENKADAAGSTAGQNIVNVAGKNIRVSIGAGARDKALSFVHQLPSLPADFGKMSFRASEVSFLARFGASPVAWSCNPV